MAMVFKDALFDAQWLRTAGHSSSEAGARLLFNQRALDWLDTVLR